MNNPEGHPDFLHPVFGIEEIYQSHKSFVVELKNVPAEFKERVPDGYIVKRHIFHEERTPNWNSRVIETAKWLKRGQEYIQQSLDDGLPGLTTQSQFIVAEAQDKGATVYEIQPKVHILCDAADVEALEKSITHFTPAKQSEIRQHIRLFLTELENMKHRTDDPEFSGYIPDLNGMQNLVLTPTGELHLIDTDKMIKVDEEEFFYQQAQDKVRRLEGWSTNEPK